MVKRKKAALKDVLRDREDDEKKGVWKFSKKKRERLKVYIYIKNNSKNNLEGR